MSAALTEIAKGLACDSRLSFGDWFNGNVRFSDKIVEAAAGDRISASVDHQRGFNEVGSGQAPDRISLDRAGAVLRIRFVTKDCEHGRRCDVHRGSPRAW